MRDQTECSLSSKQEIMAEIIPHAKQQEALERNEYEILYGGARWGGKTFCGILFPVYHINKPQYRESFNKTQVVSEEESITDTQNIWAEQSTTEEEKTSNLDDKSDKKVVEGEQMVNNVIVRQEDMAELRKIYQERHPEHKQAFGGWGAEELVSRINKF